MTYGVSPVLAAVDIEFLGSVFILPHKRSMKYKHERTFSQ